MDLKQSVVTAIQFHSQQFDISPEGKPVLGLHIIDCYALTYYKLMLGLKKSVITVQLLLPCSFTVIKLTSVLKVGLFFF
jgi:hypothetical protein